MKKVLSAVLAVIMVFAMTAMLAGCGDDSKSLVGTWEATVDIADAVNAGISGEDEELGKYLKLDKFEMVMRFTFNEDGTFVMEGDAESMMKSMEGARDVFEQGMREYLKAMFQAQGVDMELDEALKAAGIDLNALIDEMMASMDTEELAKEMRTEGQYKVKGDKLYTYDGVMDKDVYDTFTLEGDKLTLLESHGQTEDALEGLYPCEFTKVQ